MDQQDFDIATEDEPEEVFVLSIRHKHGEDHWVHRTEGGAWASLVAWVRDYWDEVFGEGEPIDPWPTTT